METRINDVVSYLGIGCDDVRMIGIKGMGGGGKTTLARAVFDQISFRFEGKSFVENVREISNASLSGFKLLQNQVLSDVLNDKDINISSVYDGKHMMKRMMPNRKVLVVLDDVDHIDQLEALAGEPNWFKPGSRIIVTTIDEQVLIAHRVKLIHDVNLLSDMEAICLFNKYAFGGDISIQQYEKLSKQVVGYAAGLPLMVRVLGSFLCGKNELEWDYKEIFLDIACIMKGWRKDNAIKAFESCGLHARNGLRVLEQRSLITISNYNSKGYKCIGMHDHIQEMGRNIVRRSHLDKPHKHSRLWIADEIEEILANDLVTKATRCILVHAEKLNPHIVLKGLGKMKKLRLLAVDIGYRSRTSEFNNIDNPDFPNALQYLRVDYYPFWSLPKAFQANNLVSLEMANSQIVQLWEAGENKVLNKLRFLNLSWSKLSTLDLRFNPNLETLNLGGCSNLVELHMPVGCLKLISADISHSRLRTLDLGLAPNLTKLILARCRNLVELHMPRRCPDLKSLQLTHSKLRTLDIGRTPVLENLDLEDCYYLEELHMADQCQNLRNLNICHSKLRTLNLGLSPNLRTLYLQECCNLVELHMLDRCLYLTSLQLANLKVRTLDIGLTPNLKTLDLRNCYDLEELHMSVGCLKLTSVDLTHSRLRTLDLGLALNLEILIIDQCPDLVELQMPNRCLNLVSLQITNSKLRTLDIGLTPNLKNLDLENSYYLEEFHMVDECQKLANLNLSHSKLRTLNLGLTPNLKNLYLAQCCNLVELTTPLGCLKEISHLYVSGGLGFRALTFQAKGYESFSVKESLRVVPLAELHLIEVSLESCPLHPDNSLALTRNFEMLISFYREDQLSLTRNFEMLISLFKCACTSLEKISGSICGLRRLRKLKMEGSFVEVPKDLDGLECLEELILLSTKINHLPDTICKLKHLKSLELNLCSLLETLPEDLGWLECLEKLTLYFTIIKHLPDSICMLKHLKSLELNACFLLEKLPEDLGRLECLEKFTLYSTTIKHLPDSICMLKHLKSLALNSCFLLEKLPEDLGLLECLEKFTLYYATIKLLPDSICMLKHLKSLELNSWFFLEKLPKDLGQLEYLEKLKVMKCERLQEIPNSIGEMKYLKHINLANCIRIEKLPEGLGCIECLKELDIEGTSISHIPQSILLLKGLLIIGSKGVLESRGFTSEMQTPGNGTS
ncbi:disease resistance protein RPV1 [Lactuca sativa]|nr:disease resistance protein RPV1 [Lactuca sativa]